MGWKECRVDHILNILVVLATFNEQDLETWVCCRKSTCDDTASAASCGNSVTTSRAAWVFDEPPATITSNSSSPCGSVVPIGIA
jgi:hypothetical protein